MRDKRQRVDPTMMELHNQTALRVCSRCGNTKAGWACKACLIATLHDEGCPLRGSSERNECTCANPITLLRRSRKRLWYGPIGATPRGMSPEVRALAPPAELTPSEQRLLDSADADGHAWIVPAQLAMARRLSDRGLITVSHVVRPHPLRGASVRRVTVHRGRETADAAHR